MLTIVRSYDRLVVTDRREEDKMFGRIDSLNSGRKFKRNSDMQELLISINHTNEYLSDIYTILEEIRDSVNDIRDDDND